MQSWRLHMLWSKFYLTIFFELLITRQFFIHRDMHQEGTKFYFYTLFCKTNVFFYNLFTSLWWKAGTLWSNAVISWNNFCLAKLAKLRWCVFRPTKGSELLKYLRNVKFEGLTGDEFNFDRNGDGPARYNIIHFKQVEQGKYQVLWNIFKLRYKNLLYYFSFSGLKSGNISSENCWWIWMIFNFPTNKRNHLQVYVVCHASVDKQKNM